MIGKFISNAAKARQDQRNADHTRNLIRAEGRIGGDIFGPTKMGHTRDFFCLDENTWVWHEEWYDERGNHNVLNTRYDIRPDGVLKSQNGQYTKLSQEEAKKLLKAAEIYAQKVTSQLYGMAA